LDGGDCVEGQRPAAGGLAAVLAAGSAFAAVPGSSTGPSSSDSPYLVRETPGITTKSVLTTGDAINEYRMVGIPDGLGAFDNGDGTFTVLMNHELGNTVGTVRAHGAKGAFVSKWVIQKDTLQVLSGADLIQKQYVMVNGAWTQEVIALSRLCSADLPAPTALYNPETGAGYDGHLFLDGEEVTGGHAYGHVVATGDSFQSADIGTAAFENVLSNPATGDKTLVVGTSDGGDQSVLVYTGVKKTVGNPVERAGLTGGTSLKIFVPTLPTESGSAVVPSGPQAFTLAPTGTAWDRPEDASWDPSKPNDLYFVTTAGMTRHSRLWRAHFTDITNPAAGGTVQKLIEGPVEGPADASFGPHMMDNITVNERGQVLVQQDPGGNDYLAGVWQYDISNGGMRRIAQHDPNRFVPGAPGFETNDEESSGIIPAPFLGEGKYLLDVQNHLKLSDPELVEKGQLLVMNVPPGQPVA
jgi:hypothetical protein